MALFGEVRQNTKRTSRSVLWRRSFQQAMLVPEALVLGVLLIGGWALGFPPVFGLLAIATMLVFGVRIGLLALAQHQLTKGAYDRADQLVRIALRLNPRSSDALALQAQVLTHRGDDEAAEAVLRHAVKLYPDDDQLKSTLASALLAQGRITEGWQMAGGTQHNTPQIIQQRAWLALHVEENPLKARTLIHEAQPDQLPPRVALPLLITLCEADIAQHANENAQQLVERIEAQIAACPQPQQAELLYHIGRLKIALGKDGTADFRRSVELDPTGRYAQIAWRSAVNPAA